MFVLLERVVMEVTFNRLFVLYVTFVTGGCTVTCFVLTKEVALYITPVLSQGVLMLVLSFYRRGQ